MTKIRVLVGASTDEILADPNLGKRFEEICSAITPGGSSLEYRLCALQIRKNRYLKKQELPLFDRLDAASAINAFHEARIRQDKADKLPHQPGVLMIHEGSRPLYLHRFDDLDSGSSSLPRSRFVQALSKDSAFWNPDPDKLGFQYLVGSELGNSPLHLWVLRLIQEMNPAFNWPVHLAAA